jgi:hypothetical protein
MRYISCLIAVACCLVVAGCSARPAGNRAGLAGARAGARAGAPTRIYGVTVDDATELREIVASLAHLPSKPAVRIAFDPGVGPASYQPAVAAIGEVADVLAEPVDSSEVNGYSAQQYVNRFRRYLAAFGSKVWLWEVGNEVNGNWLGPAGRVTADIRGAYDVVRTAGRRTALTLSYEPGCAGDPFHDMWRWAGRNISRDMKLGLDYVLVSYYEEDCNGYRPSAAEWVAVFRRLHAMFPHAKLGFGEVGANQDDPVAFKVAYLNRYYRLRIDVPGYIGGYFWWYYAEDMIPYQRSPLWRALAAAMTQHPRTPATFARSTNGICPNAMHGRIAVWPMVTGGPAPCGSSMS